MSEIKFSVAMCVYHKDDPTFFKRAVDSVVNQTCSPSEIVIVVDGPVPEKLNELIEGYAQNPIFKIIRLEQNMGHGIARRSSLEHSSNEIVALMDADDVCVADRFEKQLCYFQDGTVDIVGGDIAEFIGKEDNIVAYRSVPKSDKEIKQYIQKRCPFNQVTVMFRKEIYEKAGGYLDWYCDEDYYLWLRMMQQGAVFANTGEVLVRVRVGEEMYRRRGGWNYFKSEAKLQRYMRKHQIIGVGTYVVNVAKRLIVQVLMPNKVRGWVFKKFARSNKGATA